MFFVMMNLVLLKVIDINVILLLDIFIWTAFNILLTKAINKKDRRKIGSDKIRCKSMRTGGRQNFVARLCALH